MVHGLKSAMNSIGAVKISELAKLLEASGKAQNINYILEHHEEFMVEYKQLFTKLRNSGGFQGTEEIKQQEKEVMEVKPQETVEELWELDDEDFDNILEKLEEAIYALNNSQLLETTEELKVCCYRGKALKDIMVEAQRKIEMSDCLSAVDMIAGWRERNRR